MKLATYLSLLFTCTMMVTPSLAEPLPVLEPRVELGYRAGNERNIAISEFWVPLAQDAVGGSVLYGDLRLMGDTDDNDEFNVGVGYRQMTTAIPALGKGIWGVHGWYDRRFTERGSKFNQFTLGGEWYSDWFDAKMNAYVPFNSKKDHTQTNPNGSGVGFSGTQIVVNTDQSVREEALAGLDLELGVRVPYLDAYTDSTRFYGGAYHFEGDRAENVTGWRTRISSDVTEDFQVGFRFQNDDVRGSQGFLEATLRFPFGTKKSYQRQGLWARMDESPERDIDIVSNEAVTDDGIGKTLLNATTDAAQNVIHVDNTAGGGGTGTNESRFNTLAAAEAAAGANDIIYVHRGDGTTTGQNSGITLNDANQQLIGSGTALTFDTSRFKTPNGKSISGAAATLIPADANGAPTITNGGGDGVDVNANDITISGITIDSVSDDAIFLRSAANNTAISNVIISSPTDRGIDAINANNLMISNVSVTSAGQLAFHGHYDDNGSHIVNWDNFSATGNLADRQIFMFTRNATTMNLTAKNIASRNSASDAIALQSENTSNFVANISGAKVNNATNSGVLILSDDTSNFVANISNSTVDTTTNSGIRADLNNNSTGSIVLENNNIQNVPSVGLRFEANDNTVSDVTMKGNTVDTVTTFHGALIRARHDSTITSFTIEDNAFYNTASNTLVVDNLGGTTASISKGVISNNVLENNANTGITVNNHDGTGNFDDILIDGNTVRNSADGFRIFSDAGGVNVKIQNNLITGNSARGVIVDDDTASAFVVDLGGGSLGSTGNNQIFNNTSHEVWVDLDGGELKAENNWWGIDTGLAGGEVDLNDGTIDADPFLTETP